MQPIQLPTGAWLRPVRLPAQHSMTTSTPTRPAKASALLIPAVPALATLGPGKRVELLNFATGERLSARGTLAVELQRIAGGDTSATMLHALTESPVARAADLLTSGTVTLTPRNAVELSGFDTLFLELTGRCNEHCSHCYAESGPKVGGALHRERCLELLVAASELGFQRVQLTGGEPLLCDFLPELAARLTALEMGCEVYTNGTLLQAALLDKLRPYRPDFAFSFYSYRPEVHDRITRLTGSQRLTLAAIDRVRDAGLNLRASIVAMPENADHLEQTAAFLRNRGVQRIGYSSTFQAGRGRYFTADQPIHGGDHRPSAPAGPHGVLCVAYNGDVLPCIFNRQTVLGNVHHRDLAAIVNDPSRQPRTYPILDQATAETLACHGCRFTRAALAAWEQAR